MGREIGHCHLEKKPRRLWVGSAVASLHGLQNLPAKGFQIACFPVKIHAASAGWTRAVAILD